MIEALIIGDEILTGRRQDSHLLTTIAACKARNLRLSAAHFVGDDTQTLLNYYQNALQQGLIVLSFGGIGATPDDRTRQAVAKAAGVELVFHPEGDRLLQEKFGIDYTNERRNLIAFPAGATLIPNPINGMPGFSWQTIHCVPGFPQMAAPMIEWVLDHYCSHLAQAKNYQALTVFAPESKLIPIMSRLELLFPAVSISSLPKMHHESELGFDGSPKEVAEAINAAKKHLDAVGLPWQILTGEDNAHH